MQNSKNLEDNLNYQVLNAEKVEKIIQKQNNGESLMRHEKLWFSNITGVKKAGLSYHMSDEEIIEYAKCSLNVHYFAEKYCQIKREDGTIGKINLRDYQKDIIKLYDENRYSILMASRQIGKTVSASIYILWYLTFKNDKSVMIIANKSSTVIEIVDKIKSIYTCLPFFLKRGVHNWNQKQILFDNGSRIKTESRVKEPAIGHTINLLYFDEFANVPANIIESYYARAVPIISSIEDSKILITSTPNGYNLFYKILMNAEKEEGDPDKNNYKALRVYWWQVKGRRDTKLFPIKKKLEKYNISVDRIKKWLKDELKYKIYDKEEDNKLGTLVTFDTDDERTNIDYIRSLRFENIPLLELFTITNWKEEQTKLIGGEENFRQEFGIEFITGDKTLFDDVEMERLHKSCKEFKNIPIESFDKKLNVPYKQLEFINDLEIFDISKAKKYYILGSIDLSGGLGQDYSVLNLFKLRLKPMDYIEKNRHNFENIYDYFQIEQIGVLRSNILSVKEFAHICYMIFFELFDPDKCKVSIEYNMFGGEFLTHIMNFNEGNNNYSNGIFARYEHNKEQKKKKIGIKVGHNKNSLIKDYQSAVKKYNLIIHNAITVSEIKVFTRHDLPSGEYNFKAATGHDDCVMSIINACTLFTNISYKNLIDNYLNYEMSLEERKFIEGEAFNNNLSVANNYNTLIGSRRNLSSGANRINSMNGMWNNVPNMRFKI